MKDRSHDLPHRRLLLGGEADGVHRVDNVLPVGGVINALDGCRFANAEGNVILGLAQMKALQQRRLLRRLSLWLREQLVKAVVCALAVSVGNDAALLQQVHINGDAHHYAASPVVGDRKMNLHEFTKAGAIVILLGLGVTKGLKDRRGKVNTIRDLGGDLSN